jgi:hypothetical protein
MSLSTINDAISNTINNAISELLVVEDVTNFLNENLTDQILVFTDILNPKVKDLNEFREFFEMPSIHT